MVNIAARLPWWGGVLLALTSYVFLHYFALQTSAAPTYLKGIGAFASKELWRVIAQFFQYILPAAFLIGAVTSAVQAARARALHREVGRAPSRNALEAMSWHEFELLVGETFRRRGFQVEHRGGNGPDGGVDLALHLGKDRYLVQCKQWKSRSVGVAVVRELFGVMAAEAAVGGFVVASGTFTEEAKHFAEGRAIELVDTETLLALIHSGNEHGVPAIEGAKDMRCPQCASPMVQRTAKRGVTSGERFWGCTRYPACRGSRPA